MHPLQFKAARAMTGQTVRDIAKATGLSTNTLTRYERGDECREGTITTLRKFMSSLGVEFVDRSDGAVGLFYKPPSRG